MRQPIGLYLAEFTPGEPALATSGGVGLPCFDAAEPCAWDLIAAPAPVALADLDEGAEIEAAPDPEPELVSMPTEPVPEPDGAVALEALQAEHAAALAAARREWTEQEGATLAAGFVAALAALEGRIADTLAPLLEPFLIRAAQVKALAELRTAVGTLLAADEAAIAVSGPADLLEALRATWPDRPALRFTESDTPDVTVTAGETRIRSQLAGWARALETTLGEAA